MIYASRYDLGNTEKEVEVREKQLGSGMTLLNT